MSKILRALALVALALLAACGAATSDDGGDSGLGGSSGTGGGAGAGLTLTFGDRDPLMLTPSAVHAVTLQVLPRGVHAVRFALVAGSGSVADAALDATERTSGDDGTVSVNLTAPSVPTRFELRALVGTEQRTLSVAVEASGEATLLVRYSYAGRRTVTQWVAEVYDDGRTCADLEGTPPEGPSPSQSLTVSAAEPIELHGVPVGKPLAVTLRAGHFAGGCSGLEGVFEGQSNTVRVTVTDRPIQLDRSRVTLTLGLAGAETALSQALAPVIAAELIAVLGGADDDLEALLDAMQEATPAADSGRFYSTRSAEGWNLELALARPDDANGAIRGDLERWLTTGVPTLARDDAFVGTLETKGGVADGAAFGLTRVAGFAPRAAGFARQVDATWKGDADDHVVIGTTLTFNPSALLVLAALAPALAEVPTAASIGQALGAIGQRCASVAETLTAHGQAPGQSYRGCDLACTRALCEAGAELLVARASDALSATPAELRVAATGVAEVGEEAELRALVGSWLGELGAAGGLSELGGTLLAGTE